MMPSESDEVEALKPHYDPLHFIAKSQALSEVMSLLESGHFSLLEPGIFDPIIDSIRSPNDPWMIAADFESYRLAQVQAAKAYRDPHHWTQMSIRNTAASGRFSSDVTIGQYRDEIWGIA